MTVRLTFLIDMKSRNACLFGLLLKFLPPPRNIRLLEFNNYITQACMISNDYLGQLLAIRLFRYS